MSREQLAIKVWNSRASIEQQAARYGMSHREIRELADLGCKLQAQGSKPQANAPFTEEEFRILREMAEAGATWKEIADALGKSVSTVSSKAKRRGIVKNRKKPEIRWKKEARP